MRTVALIVEMPATSSSTTTIVATSKPVLYSVASDVAVASSVALGALASSMVLSSVTKTVTTCASAHVSDVNVSAGCSALTVTTESSDEAKETVTSSDGIVSNLTSIKLPASPTSSSMLIDEPDAETAGTSVSRTMTSTLMDAIDPPSDVTSRSTRVSMGDAEYASLSTAETVTVCSEAKLAAEKVRTEDVITMSVSIGVTVTVTKSSSDAEREMVNVASSLSSTTSPCDAVCTAAMASHDGSASRYPSMPTGHAPSVPPSPHMHGLHGFPAKPAGQRWQWSSEQSGE